MIRPLPWAGLNVVYESGIERLEVSAHCRGRDLDAILIATFLVLKTIRINLIHVIMSNRITFFCASPYFQLSADLLQISNSQFKDLNTFTTQLSYTLLA
jgi:hypothetical protein